MKIRIPGAELFHAGGRTDSVYLSFASRGVKETTKNLPHDGRNPGRGYYE
jgi:hypothetical protein